MAPSLISTLSSAFLLSSTVSAAKSYQLYDSYDSSNFLEKFKFFESDYSTGNYNDVDPTGGYVNYRSSADAQAQGLLKTVDGELYLGVDSESTLDPAGVGRSSVRIESKYAYKKGLFITDFSHLPKPACGAWPAFWTVGNPWPAAGEIDIVETWNLDGVNKVVIHTDSNVGECRLDGNGMTGTVSKPNCANFAPGQADNEGCAGLDSAAPFGSPDGGIYAMEWTDTAIRVWGFTHDNAPADIASNPNPENWGTPSFTTSVCEADKVFGEAKMVMNIDFCGVAGNDGIWDQEGGCKAQTNGATCKEWVANNPAAFADVFFKLKSVKIYNLEEGEAAPVPSSTAVASSTPVATSVAATSAVSSSAAVVAPSSSSAVESEKPVEATSAEASAPAATEPAVTAPAATIPADLTTRLTTSTVYETNIETITSCAPTVTNCPAKETPVVVTNVVPVTTTVCPVVDVPTQLTVSKTEIHTITSCPPSVPNCPVGSKTTVTSQEVVQTTVPVPVESYTAPPAADKPSVTTTPAAAVPPAGGAITTYKTNIVTITSCAPTVTDCPVGKVSTIVTSEVIPATTTAKDEKPVPVTTGAPEVPGVQTTYKTNIVTITSCPPTVPDCPVGKETTIVTSELITPTAPAPGVPATPTEGAQNPPAENPATTPGAGVPTAGVPAEQPSVSVPAGNVPTAGVPAVGTTASAQEPEASTPAATTPAAAPTTLVVAPSSPYNGTLTTARFPVGTGTPCIGAQCPATTTGVVTAGAGKLSSGAFVMAAALAVFVF